MQKERLLKLADFLDTVPRKAFDIALWGRNPQIKPEGKVPGECGFAGCAVGWAAHQKMFKNFSLDRVSTTPVYFHHGAERYGFDAVERLFGITDKEAVYLFHRKYYQPRNDLDGFTRPADPTPGEVADRIRAFVAKRPKTTPGELYKY